MSKWMCLLVGLLCSVQTANAAVNEHTMLNRKSSSLNQQTMVRTTMVLRVMSRTEIVAPNGERSTTLVPFHPVMQSLRFPVAGESELFVGAWKLTVMPANGILSKGSNSIAVRLQREEEAGSDQYLDLGVNSFNARVWGRSSDRDHWTLVSFDSRRFESEERGLIVDLSFGDNEERSLVSKRLGLNTEIMDKFSTSP